MKLIDTPTASHFVDAGLLDARQLALIEQELSQAETALDGKCPWESARLRSAEAVEAYGAWLYVLARALRPAVVVETGVQNGCSTELILWALHRNRHGQLYSVDSGPTSSDGSHKTAWNTTQDGIPGKNIIAGLKERWNLTTGLSRDRLPDLCRKVANVDMFWHDSDHSSENVAFEFATVAPYVTTGGALCMHDFTGQPVGMDAPGYCLAVPNLAPHLRVWRKSPGGPG
jgi:predicted O-methyltransferase YrrM